MFVVEFILGSLAFVFRKGLGHRLVIELQDGLKHHYNITAQGPNSLVTIWDHLQTEVSSLILLFSVSYNTTLRRLYCSSNVVES